MAIGDGTAAYITAERSDDPGSSGVNALPLGTGRWGWLGEVSVQRAAWILPRHFLKAARMQRLMYILLVLVVGSTVCTVMMTSSGGFTRNGPSRRGGLVSQSDSDPYGEDHYSRTPLLPGTFLYLVMGIGDINFVWNHFSAHSHVYVWYLSWRDEPSLPNRTEHFRTTMFINSSWASGRNRLLEIGLETEREQGWMFEYYIFWDDDVRLMFRHNISVHEEVFSSFHAEARLRKLLLRDRPARAGIEFPYATEDLAYIPMECARGCAFDAALDIYHRSALLQVLPYPTWYDMHNWWMASETTSYRSAALFADYCNTYREIVHDSEANEHYGYPQGAHFKEIAIGQYQTCIGRRAASEKTWRNIFAHGMNRPGVAPQEIENCTQQSMGVSYYDLIDAERKRFRECNSQQWK